MFLRRRYYYLLGLDSTGPFMLTLFRITTRDVPHFMVFYLIVLIAFTTAISLLSNNGNFHLDYSMWHWVMTFYTLIQNTVSLDPTHAKVTDIENVSPNLRWISDLLITAYYASVVIIMLNLLIGMISATFDNYTKYSNEILVLEKYNMLEAMERAMRDDEYAEHKRYATGWKYLSL